MSLEKRRYQPSPLSEAHFLPPQDLHLVPEVTLPSSPSHPSSSSATASLPSSALTSSRTQTLFAAFTPDAATGPTMDLHDASYDDCLSRASRFIRTFKRTTENGLWPLLDSLRDREHLLACDIKCLVPQGAETEHEAGAGTGGEDGRDDDGAAEALEQGPHLASLRSHHQHQQQQQQKQQQQPLLCGHPKKTFLSTRNSRRSSHAYLFWFYLFGHGGAITDDMLKSVRRILRPACPLGLNECNGHAKTPGQQVCINPFHYKLVEPQAVVDILVAHRLLAPGLLVRARLVDVHHFCAEIYDKLPQTPHNETAFAAPRSRLLAVEEGPAALAASASGFGSGLSAFASVFAGPSAMTEEDAAGAPVGAAGQEGGVGPSHSHLLSAVGPSPLPLPAAGVGPAPSVFHFESSGPLASFPRGQEQHSFGPVPLSAPAAVAAAAGGAALQQPPSYFQHQHQQQQMQAASVPAFFPASGPGFPQYSQQFYMQQQQPPPQLQQQPAQLAHLQHLQFQQQQRQQQELQYAAQMHQQQISLLQQRQQQLQQQQPPRDRPAPFDHSSSAHSAAAAIPPALAWASSLPPSDSPASSITRPSDRASPVPSLTHVSVTSGTQNSPPTRRMELLTPSHASAFAPSSSASSLWAQQQPPPPQPLSPLRTRHSAFQSLRAGSKAETGAAAAAAARTSSSALPSDFAPPSLAAMDTGAYGGSDGTRPSSDPSSVSSGCDQTAVPSYSSNVGGSAYLPIAPRRGSSEHQQQQFLQHFHQQQPQQQFAHPPHMAMPLSYNGGGVPCMLQQTPHGPVLVPMWPSAMPMPMPAPAGTSGRPGAAISGPGSVAGSVGIAVAPHGSVGPSFPGALPSGASFPPFVGGAGFPYPHQQYYQSMPGGYAMFPPSALHIPPSQAPLYPPAAFYPAAPSASGSMSVAGAAPSVPFPFPPLQRASSSSTGRSGSEYAQARHDEGRGNERNDGHGTGTGTGTGVGVTSSTASSSESSPRRRRKRATPETEAKATEPSSRNLEGALEPSDTAYSISTSNGNGNGNGNKKKKFGKLSSGETNHGGSPVPDTDGDKSGARMECDKGSSPVNLLSKEADLVSALASSADAATSSGDGGGGMGTGPNHGDGSEGDGGLEGAPGEGGVTPRCTPFRTASPGLHPVLSDNTTIPSSATITAAAGALTSVALARCTPKPGVTRTFSRLNELASLAAGLDFAPRDGHEDTCGEDSSTSMHDPGEVQEAGSVEYEQRETSPRSTG